MTVADKHSEALIISSTEKGRNFLAELLKGSEYAKCTLAASGSEARRMLAQGEYELVVINAPLSDEFGHELALSIAGSSSAGVLLIVKNEITDDVSEKVENGGVVVIGKPLGKQAFFQAVKLIMASRRRLMGLANENIKLHQKIEEIRLIDRAKCVLIQYLKMTEPQAHRYIEKQAMDLRETRKKIAENILKTYEV